MKNNLREILESSLIHEALYTSNGFAEMANILKPHNFIYGITIPGNKKLNSAIWECLQELYPTKPINIISICALLADKYETGLAYEVMAYNDLLNIAGNRRFYCLMLLETDLRAKFPILLKKIKKDFASNVQALGDLDEIILHVNNPTTDIFEIINNVENYFSQESQYEAAFEEVKEFKSKIVDKVDEIKRMSHVQTLLNNFDKLYNFNTPRKLMINSLLDMIKYTMNVSEVKPEFQEQVFALRNSLFA